MKRKLRLSVFSFMLFALLGLFAVTNNQRPAVKTEAVSSTRIYLILNDDILNRAPAYKLSIGSGEKDLYLLSTIDPLHAGDIYTYYVDGVPTNAMTLKNNGGNSINFYNIVTWHATNPDYRGFGVSWDTITFSSPITNWDGVPAYTTSVYEPPIPEGETYTVTLYNGEEVIGTQTAYEDVVFNPVAINVPGYRFNGWFIDEDFETEYVPEVLVADLSLFGKYEEIELVTTRIFITNTNAWWYNDNALIKLYYSIDGSSFDSIFMTKESGNLHSAILPHNLSKVVKFDRINPNGSGQVWNPTGNFTVNMESFDVTLLTGKMDHNGSGSLTATDYSNTSPYIVDLKTNVPLLACDNYGDADILLSKYEALPGNEKRIIDNLRITSHDDVEMTYSTVLAYYANYKAVMIGPQERIYSNTVSLNSILIIGLAGLTVLGGYQFVIKRKTY